MLWATCINCQHYWAPYGERPRAVPSEDNLICPKCNNEAHHNWYDPETLKLLKQQELGLLQNNDKVDVIDQKISLLEQKLSLEEQKRSTLESELRIFKDWVSRREEDFRRIEELAREVEEDEKFRQDNR